MTATNLDGLLLGEGLFGRGKNTCYDGESLGSNEEFILHLSGARVDGGGKFFFYNDQCMRIQEMLCAGRSISTLPRFGSPAVFLPEATYFPSSLDFHSLPDTLALSARIPVLDKNIPA